MAEPTSTARRAQAHSSERVEPIADNTESKTQSNTLSHTSSSSSSALLSVDEIRDGQQYIVLQGYGTLAPQAVHYLNGIDGASYTFKGGVCRNVNARVARFWLAGGEDETPTGIKRYVPAVGNIRVLRANATERDFASAVPGASKDVSPARAGAVLKGLSPRELVGALGQEDATFLVHALAEELGLHVSSSFTGNSGRR